MRAWWIAVSVGVVTAAGRVAMASAGAAGEAPNLFAGNIGNAIWTLLIFALVLVVLRKFAWGPILKALQNRERFIRDSLDEAAKDRDDAAKLLAEHTAKMQQAQGEAQAVFLEARRDADDARKRLLAESQDEAKRLINQAKQEIDSARAQAVKDLYAEAAALATSVAGRIVQRELNPQDHEDLVRESLRQLQADQSQN